MGVHRNDNQKKLKLYKNNIYGRSFFKKEYSEHSIDGCTQE